MVEYPSRTKRVGVTFEKPANAVKPDAADPSPQLGDRLMKKFALFSAVALLLSSISIGCSSDGTSSWCRSGSLFPVVRSRDSVQTVYTTGNTISSCDPCVPAGCEPCEPLCNPCEPVCDPCLPSGSNMYSSPSVVPGPVVQ